MATVSFKPPRHPWERADLQDSELLALKALSAGVASERQQQIALWVILVKLCRVDDMSFRPGGADGDRETIFAEGMRSVGSAIREAINRPMKESGNATGPDSTTLTGNAAGRKNPKPERPKSKPAKPGTESAG